MADSSFPHDARFPSDTDVLVDDAPVVSEALQTPTKAVSVGLQTLFFLANVAIWLAKFPFQQIVLPLQILAFDATHKTTDLAIIAAVGSTFGLLANPIAGALSDRTTGRWGRRRPWLVSTSVLSAAILILLAYAPNLWTLILEWTLYQMAVNAVLAALLAIIPDQVPRRQRGTVSSFAGLSIPLGLVLGSILVTQILGSRVLPSYYAISAILLVIMLLLALVLPDKPLTKGDLPPFHLGEFIASFWVSPRKYPDFAWAWITRFLAIMSSSAVTFYLLYYFQDVIHATGKAATRGVANFNYIYVAVLLVASLGGGFLSDRLQRRKIFVLCGGIIIAISMLLLAFMQTQTGTVFAAIFFGLGFGVYLAVDIALITEVLPSASSRGKDLGVFNIANTLPQVLVPIVAALTINAFHNYTVLFVIVAVSAALSGLLVLPIKSVR